MKVESLYMARRRFFVEGVKNNWAELLGFEARHLARVLRVTVGQQFEISDNQNVYLAEIAEVRPDRVVFRVLEELAPGPPLPRITLIAALVKFDRFEWLIEKATETGVWRIAPVEAARTESGLLKAGEKRLDRWRRIARESSQQSRRDTMPEVLPPQKLKDATAESYMARFRLDEQPGAPLLIRQTPAREGNTAVLSGPEGGWTEEERAMLDRGGWSPVSLGPTVYRAETAGAIACAILAQTWFSNCEERYSSSSP